MDTWGHVLMIIVGALLFSALQVVSLWLSLKRRREEKAILEMKRRDSLIPSVPVPEGDAPVPPYSIVSESSSEPEPENESFSSLLQAGKDDFRHSQAAELLAKLKFMQEKYIPECDRRTVVVEISSSFDGVIRALYDTVPDIRRADINTCMLSYLGCDNDVIAAVECVSPAAIRQRKSRLARRIPEEIYSVLVG